MIKRQLERPVDVRSVHGLLLPRQPKCQRNCNCRRRVLVLSVHAPVPVLPPFKFLPRSLALPRLAASAFGSPPDHGRNDAAAPPSSSPRTVAGHRRGGDERPGLRLRLPVGRAWARCDRQRAATARRVLLRSDTGIATGGPARGEPQPTPPGPRPGSLLLNAQFIII